jgi:hypothetical protein
MRRVRSNTVYTPEIQFYQYGWKDRQKKTVWQKGKNPTVVGTTWFMRWFIWGQ